MEIHVLDNSLINKIAAGEVVERPSSVVKELVENSIDAGATAVTVEIRDGGISLIKITDNGKGIPKNQVKTAFLRHATSKLNKFEELGSIMTLGFRGEALSSIAAVAQVEVVTKTADESEGTKIQLEMGKVIGEEEVAANTGTIFTVKNIFHALPARRKFLKKPATESSYISEVVNRLALGHPHIAFKYINNGNVILQTSGNNDLKTCAMYIYGRDTASKMLEIYGERDGYVIEGLIGKPELNRGNRNYESFFINNRYIKSNIISGAVEDAFKGRLMVGKFPCFIINMTVPENTVDVNVHPTKLEVRFSNEDFIYDFVYEQVQKVFKDKVLIPQVNWDKPKYSEVARVEVKDGEQLDFSQIANKGSLTLNEGAVAVEKEPEQKNESIIKSAIDRFYPEKRVINDKIKENKVTEQSVIKAEQPYIPVAEPKVENEVKQEVKPFFCNYKIIGQLFSTYWILEQDNSMYIIDQHAAHERALYEELVEKAMNKNVESQLLLRPIAVNVGEREKNAIEENRELLESFGFQIDVLNDRAYALRGVPYIFNAPESSNFFMEIVDRLCENGIKNVYEAKLDTIATMSCKAAVKGNDRLSFTEAKALVDRILKLENPFNCPHGRPTVIEMTKYELEKKFKRIQN